MSKISTYGPSFEIIHVNNFKFFKKLFDPPYRDLDFDDGDDRLTISYHAKIPTNGQN